MALGGEEGLKAAERKFLAPFRGEALSVPPI